MPYTKEQAKLEVQKLVDKYKDLIKNDNRELTEEETKKDFILPLFRALNWDVENSKEVSAEEKISKKRVDYGFKIQNIPKFFLEAKPLDVNLELKEIEQAIKYSYWKWTTWAVLTNFKEIHVYNALWKGGIADKRFIKLNYEEYLEKFDFLWYLSKDSFLDKSIDNFAEDVGKKNKKVKITPIMEELFEDMIKWRGGLSSNILENKENVKILKGNNELLDECVQRVIDRLIFIRVVEDKEFNRVLMTELLQWQDDKRGRNFIEVLNGIFRNFDKDYDSRLFSKHISEKLLIDDKTLHDIIYELYGSRDVEYDFSAIDVNVLGSIYEEYLGYVLRKGKGKVAENFQHRKEMGIYYTPTFIVDFIVRNAILEILKEKDVGNIKALDPACGSGSFLIKIFDNFLDSYKDPKHVDYDEKVRILTNNIFGVDLDSQAVEIAQLNLLLRIVEQDKPLPMLQNNIKIGNSLIEDKKINDKAFIWDENFQSDNNGFDVIVSNPPYNAELKASEKDYFKSNYKEFKSSDTAEYFLKKSLDLLKPDGVLGFIVPKSIAYYESWRGIREYIFKKCQLLHVANVGIGFSDVNLEEIILIIKKTKPKNNYTINVSTFSDLKRPKQEKHIIVTKPLDSSIMTSNNIILFSPLTEDEQKIIKKIDQNSIKFDNIIDDSFRGMYISDKDKEKLRKGNIKFVEKEPWIQRYSLEDFIEINTHEDFIDRKKLDRILKEKFVFKVLRGSRLSVYYDPKGEFLTPSNVVNVIVNKNKGIDPKVLLAILNSSLISFYIQKTLFSDTTESARHMDYPYIALIPLPKNLKNIQKIIKLVEQLIETNEKLINLKETDERQYLLKDSQKINAEIDNLIYDIYDISDKEKQIIEESV